MRLKRVAVFSEWLPDVVVGGESGSDAEQAPRCAGTGGRLGTGHLDVRSARMSDATPSELILQSLREALTSENEQRSGACFIGSSTTGG